MVHPLAPPSAPRGPLAGIGILVTRPARQAAGLVSQLAALGATPIVFPAIVILPPSDPAPLAKAHADLDRYDAAIFVSSNAAEYGVPSPSRWPASVTAYATGPGTAAALMAAGLADARIPQTTFDSEGLLALPALARVRKRRVMVVGAPGGRDLLPRELRARGARIEFINVYERARPRLDRRHLRALEAAPTPLISLFSSADALTNLHAVLSPPLFAHLAANDCVVSSARIAEVAHTLGFARVHAAASAEPAALLERACIVMALHRL